MKNIAIIGGGIAGLSSAYYLRAHHNITIFEANDYVGGHTATVSVNVDNQRYAIDTGFIVFNDRTYPLFESLLAELNVAVQPTEMSFSVHDATTGFEYNGHTLKSVFSQARHYFSPSFYRFLFEIWRFNRTAKKWLQEGIPDTVSVGDFLKQCRFSSRFCSHYLLPMGAAIWSMPLGKMREMPLTFFLHFFENHGLLDIINRPQWKVIKGGSHQYVNALLNALSHVIKVNTPVTQVRRLPYGVEIMTSEETLQFDEVIFACHSDQALAILDDPSADEVAVLSALPYQKNRVTLHTDTDWLPTSKRAWAAWNYRLLASDTEESPLTVTYNMNLLQGISSPHTFCVTLNSSSNLDPKCILRQFEYAHPMFGFASLRAQKKKSLIQGKRNTWFCGAYWGYGFHEDGVASAKEVANALLLADTFKSAS